jgi:hypothetical protein
MAFEEFELFWLGEEFMGHSLRGITRSVYELPPPNPPTTRTDSVTFAYGDCTPNPAADGSCTLPITIHINAYCTRPPDVLLGPHIYDDGSWDAIEVSLGSGYSIWTSDVHIDIQVDGDGPSPREVAAELRSLDPSGRQPGEPFGPIDQAVAEGC